MPGLFVALSVLAFLAFGAAHASALSRTVTLTPGRRWALDVSFGKSPDQTKFESVFRQSKGMSINAFQWLSPSRVVVMINPLLPMNIDVGAPGPGGEFTITSATDLGPSPAPTLAAPAAASTTQTTPTPWLLSFQLDSTALDKPGFETDLRQNLGNLRVTGVSWKDPKSLDVAVVATEDLKSYVGKSETVRNIRTTIVAANRLPSVV